MVADGEPICICDPDRVRVRGMVNEVLKLGKGDTEFDSEAAPETDEDADAGLLNEGIGDADALAACCGGDSLWLALGDSTVPMVCDGLEPIDADTLGEPEGLIDCVSEGACDAVRVDE
jgi:hypothetical protein